MVTPPQFEANQSTGILMDFAEHLAAIILPISENPRTDFFCSKGLLRILHELQVVLGPGSHETKKIMDGLIMITLQYNAI